MKCLLLVGLLCVVLVIADKSNDDKVLCKRIMCEDDDICAQYAIDDRGCPTCTCTKIDECKVIAPAKCKLNPFHNRPTYISRYLNLCRPAGYNKTFVTAP